MRSEYLSRGETGKARIIALAKEDGGSDDRANRVLKLSIQEQELIKYHSSSCYRSFQRDVEKKRKPDLVIESEARESAISMNSSTSEDQRRSKSFKSSSADNFCVICGLSCKTVKQKKIHKLLRICEKQKAQKLLNAAKF